MKRVTLLCISLLLIAFLVGCMIGFPGNGDEKGQIMLSVPADGIIIKTGDSNIGFKVSLFNRKSSIKCVYTLV